MVAQHSKKPILCRIVPATLTLSLCKGLVRVRIPSSPPFIMRDQFSGRTSPFQGECHRFEPDIPLHINLILCFTVRFSVMVAFETHYLKDLFDSGIRIQVLLMSYSGYYGRIVDCSQGFNSPHQRQVLGQVQQTLTCLWMTICLLSKLCGFDSHC